MKTALTIAGSDSSGGAGIQADLKTFSANGVYGMSVITAVTSQNTTGVYDILDVPKQNVTSQLDAVFEDIFPDAVKIGMVSAAETVDAIADALEKYKPKNTVLDTVMVSTSGSRLISDDALDRMREKLFPLADIITPNVPEAEILSDMKIINCRDMEEAAKKIFDRYNVAVLLKGGHRVNDSNDFLLSSDIQKWFVTEKIDNSNTHGTGCTLSSAIAAGLAKGYTLEKAVEEAKAYITGALSAMLNLGKGSGPLMHNYKTVQ